MSVLFRPYQSILFCLKTFRAILTKCFASSDKGSHSIVKHEAVEKPQPILEIEKEKPKGRSKKSFNAVSILL